ncbi:MAG: pirin family protein [Acidimicrobiales bacterium]
MLEITASHAAEVEGLPVRRALPRRGRRTVGPWCFVDHFGPVPPERSATMQVGPHPHIGLHTVTWVLEGEVLHTDSLGSEQLIRPGQVNLMTAGRGVAHAESARSSAGLHGAQLWVAQPDATRHGPPDFVHLPELPELEMAAGAATVLVGGLVGGPASPAPYDWPILGASLALRGGGCSLALDPSFEHALVVLVGRVEMGEQVLEPGHLGHLAAGVDELVLQTPELATVLLLGGRPFEAEPLMWWNFVGRERAEIDAARAEWEAGDARFGSVATPLERIGAPMPFWAP